MKIYRIKVNGKRYEVEVEVVENKQDEIKKGEVESTSNLSYSNDEIFESIKSPMQGTVLSLKVRKGESVSKGDILMIIEAMKMENEIISNVSGTVEDVFVSQGQSIDNEQILLVIRRGR